MRGNFGQRLAAAIIAAALLLFAGVTAAFAHAQLVGSDPPDGAVLTKAPELLTLTLSEPVTPLVARLIDPQGKTQLINGVGGKGQTVTFAVPAGLGQGTHILSWRVTSSDGHPIGGGLVFSIGAPSAGVAVAPSPSDPAIHAGLWVARFLIMSGLVFGVGGAFFQEMSTLRQGSGASRLLSLAIWAGLAGVVMFVPLQGLDALGLDLTGALEPETWQAGLWATSYGRAAMLAATALLLAFASRQQRRTFPARLLASLALLAAGLAFAAAGHAASASPRWLMAPAVFVHTIAVLYWLGALAPLGASILTGGVAATTALNRFSTAIPFAIAALLASGVFIAVVQVQSFPALLASDYGLVLMAKLALVAAILALALFNRFALTRPTVAGDAKAARGLSRNIRLEIVLGFAVIAVLGLWRFTPPPRALAGESARTEVQQVRASNEGVSALLSIQPPIAGPVRVDVSEISLDGKAITPVTVSVELGKPSYGIGPFLKEAKAEGDGVYRAEGFVLPIDGYWVVNIDIVISDFRAVKITDVFDVRKASG